MAVENAHPAIITPEELRDALARRSESRAHAKYAQANGSAYLFTGRNLEGGPMFVCASCGGNVIGYRNGTPNWRKYVCGVARNKGAAGCTDLLPADQHYLESQVLGEIRARYTAPGARSRAVAHVLERLAEAPAEHLRTVEELKARAKELADQRDRLVDSIKKGVPAELVAAEASRLAGEIARTDRDLRALADNPPASLKATAAQVESFLTDFETVFAAGTPEQRKGLVKTFVHHLELDAKKQEVRVAFYADPQLHSFGVRRGT